MSYGKGLAFIKNELPNAEEVSKNVSYRKGSTFHNNLAERQDEKKDVSNKSNMDGNKISKSNLKEVSQCNVKSKEVKCNVNVSKFSLSLKQLISNTFNCIFSLKILYMLTLLCTVVHPSRCNVKTQSVHRAFHPRGFSDVPMFNTYVSDLEKSFTSDRTVLYPFYVTSKTSILRMWKVYSGILQGDPCPLLTKPFKSVTTMTKVNWTIQFFLFIVLVLGFSSLLYFNTSQKQLQCLLHRAANIGYQFQDTVVQEHKFCWPSTSLLTSRNCKELNNIVSDKVVNRVNYLNYFKICEKYWKFCNYFVVNSPVTYRTLGNVTYGTKKNFLDTIQT